MRIIALLFAFVLAGCTGNRLNAEANPTAVALSAPARGRCAHRYGEAATAI